MKKFLPLIIFFIIAVPLLVYLYYPMQTASPPIDETLNSPNQTNVIPIQPPIPEPIPQTPIVIHLDTNATQLIAKSHEIQQKTLDAEINKLTPSTTSTFRVPDMDQTFLTDTSSSSTFEPQQSVLDSVQLRGLIVNNTTISAFISMGADTAFKVRKGSTFQGVKVARITTDGIELKQGKKSRWIRSK